MVIEGYSDKGTRDAANFLVNSKIGSLRGANLMVDVNESILETNVSSTEEKVKEKEEENISVEIEEEKEKSVSELTERIANKSKEISMVNKTKEKVSIERKEAVKTEQKKEASVLKRIVDWIFSLFK